MNVKFRLSVNNNESLSEDSNRDGILRLIRKIRDEEIHQLNDIIISGWIESTTVNYYLDGIYFKSWNDFHGVFVNTTRFAQV